MNNMIFPEDVYTFLTSRVTIMSSNRGKKGELTLFDIKKYIKKIYQKNNENNEKA